ncbi:hypothetical protein TH63_11815 [Rufibacter radiotolerans]|uniref:Uncharacterized protein n=2 Tax=Rufibacter radiotolerans TaxID=1379910 RepID=A0A0H4VR03_9BACT|nr:hypothetical protein TH63_11815 [Rufibacter radiotolerans]
MLPLAGYLNSCQSAAPAGAASSAVVTTKGKSLGEIALEESKVPVRPGVPGKVPFWNEEAKLFIYAPAFDYKVLQGAVKYLYTVVSVRDQKKFSFEAKVPYEALSPIWAQVPVGTFSVQVVGLNAAGDSLGLAGKGSFYRASPFNGPYHEPTALAYDQSALVALEKLMAEKYVQYWFTYKKPDPKYLNYRYPAKIHSALVIGAITYARLKPNTPEAQKATELARIVADFMLDLRYKPGTAWEYFVPTYYGVKLDGKKAHMNDVNNFTMMGVDAGYAFLDLYDHTKDVRYLEAAQRISQTYLKNQMPNGSWYQFVHHATNKPVADNIAIPTAVTNYFDRLRTDYGVKGLETPTKKALQYILDNPVKTFDWQGQFEDVYARPPYKNLSREQACDLAIYLFNNSKNNPGHVALAEELVRFSEDQFVIWEQPRPYATDNKTPGRNSKDWITPSVQEQYVFWYPVGRSAGIMVETFWHAYEVTKKPLYLAKAKSLANSFTVVQQAHEGEFPTFFTKYNLPLWLNSAVYPAKVLMDLNQNLNKLPKGLL